MKTKVNNLLLFFFAAYLFVAVIYIFAPVTSGQDARGQCQQRCTEQYQACRRAANSNQSTCKQAFDACRDACRTGSNTNDNTNTNQNGNTNTPGRL